MLPYDSTVNSLHYFEVQLEGFTTNPLLFQPIRSILFIQQKDRGTHDTPSAILNDSPLEVFFGTRVRKPGADFV